MNTTSNNYSIDLKSRVINEYNKNILSVIEIALRLVFPKVRFIIGLNFISLVI
jgi:hypothetical protein